ncbi:MAG: ATP synthase F1 subunit gamma [Flavobacteriaceae bacterium]|nr:ATP synthase F1 subunit gamma [Flavobacteriaceae bacterium]|tara:strand:+ start:9631 stop:10494 length:864 start_codon:yes stop_codon:yes gene_type:complete
MANLKEIRNRIGSVSSTMQITSAMKMVSAAKLKKAQDSIIAMRPYSIKLTELIQSLTSSNILEVDNILSTKREIKKILIVAITSNRGLCGAFNSNIIKKVQFLINDEFKSNKVSLVTIGKKGTEFFTKKNLVYSSHDKIYDDLNYKNVSEITKTIIDSFIDGSFDKVMIVYNQFKNAATQIIKSEQFLPIENQTSDQNPEINNYIYEPSEELVLNELIPKSLKIQLLKSIKDSIASEHGARMTAMHKATDNATELRDQLKLSYNKARQAAITNEILEIVGGAEALKG